MDDLGPFALNIYGDRVIRGRYVWYALRLADVQGLYPGLWYLRPGASRARLPPGTGCMSISAESPVQLCEQPSSAGCPSVESMEIAMGKTWVLDTETKGTGAHVVPLEKTLEKPAPKKRASRPRRPAPVKGPTAPKPKSRRAKKAGSLPPGHVRKKATGEIGKVQAVDPRAGTATVKWLKQGRASTVPITAISRR
jgi:hypothetical protein